MKVKLTVSYDGTSYCGWQVQPNGISVQQVLEDALEKVTGIKIKTVGKMPSHRFGYSRIFVVI